MASKCLITLVIRKVQITAGLRFYLTPVRTASIKKISSKRWRVLAARDRGGEGRPSYTGMGMQTDAATIENHTEVPHQPQTRTALWSRILSLVSHCWNFKATHQSCSCTCMLIATLLTKAKKWNQT